MLSCDFCEISKDTFTTEHFWTTASAFLHTKRDLCLEKSSLEKLKSRNTIKKCPFNETEQLQAIPFSEDDASIEDNKNFNSSYKANIQKGNPIVM